MCKDHGYIAGEQYECPICHQKTEVYSRITGYYRPVQNWNDGKLQEFKQRTTYKVGNGTFNDRDGIKVKMPQGGLTKTAMVDPQDGSHHLKLFTTSTCPNCKIALRKLESAGIKPEVINAENDLDDVARYGIMQAPTLVDEVDGTPQLYCGVSEIIKFIENA